MALTPDELRQRIPNWSLESDGQLLQYMVSIAKNIEDKCSKTRDNLNGLLLQVHETEVKLANATNQFSAVEQVKFVENRVEEDDESFYGLRRRRQQIEEPRNDTKPEDGDGERTMDDLIQLAVERSIEGMYKSYEKVTLQLTDSESSDEDDLAPPSSTRLTDSAELTAGKATIMRAVPNYSFIERPLPHVIGSKEWQNKWHVGLIDSEDESSSDRKEEYSESPSETDDGGMFPSQPNSKNHTPSESESSIWGAEGHRKRAPSIDPSVTGDDVSSVYSYASSSKVPRTLPPVVAARGMLSEGSRLKPPSLFPEEPPEEDVRRRGAERGLFDDSPEEDEPTPVPTPQPRQPAATANDATKTFFKGNSQPTARKIVNLFDDEPPEPLPEGFGVPEQKKPINLFIDSEDENEEVQQAKDNVRNNNATPAKQSLKPQGPRAMTKLVDELNNNFRKQQEQPAPEKTKPVAADDGGAIRNRSSLVSNQRPVTNLFDDEPPVDEFDQLFIAANPSARKTVPPQPQATRVEKKPVNLFAEDDEDDYDGIVVGSNETRPQKSPSQSSYISPGKTLLPKPAERLPTLKKKSIFDESDSEEEAKEAKSATLFGSTTKTEAAGVVPTIPKATPKVTKSIFSDSSEAENEDEDDDALFGASSSILKGKLDALKKNVGSTVVTLSQADTKPTSKSKSLFDEDSEENEPVVDKDEGLFGSVSKPSSSAVPLALDKTVKTAAPRVSLFDDKPPSDDDDALFGKGSSKTQNNVLPSGESEMDKQTASTSVSVPKQSFDSSEPKVSQSMEKEAPATSNNNSIRSLIQKKSIFNSDSESEEENDSIFGAVVKSTEKSSVSSTKLDASDGVEKSELNQATVAKETIEKDQLNGQKETVEEQLTLNDKKEGGDDSFTVKDNGIAQNTLEPEKQTERTNEPSSNQSPVDDPVEIPVESKKSLFEESSSDNGSVSESSIALKVNEAQPQACDGMNNVVSTLQEDESLQTAQTEPSKQDEKSLPDETPAGMMIANDIDYYLHTNEPLKDDDGTKPSSTADPVTPPSSKSEPKSALNFSPIGLFDDVPPPDDGDETDDAARTPKQRITAEGTVPPPIMDDHHHGPAYGTESQSLNFIPTGSTGGGNRSRYLFDDEPPPDEADDAFAGSFTKPSTFKMGNTVVKGLFDNPAPASLPAMVEDSRTESSKPGRPKVNKLNTKLAINVAALLPGARRPNPVGPVASSPEKPSAVSTNDTASSEVPAKPAKPEETSNSEKLTGLNKGRARIPTKRKPPSRQTLRASSLGASSLQTSLDEEEDRVEKDRPMPSTVADDRIVVGSEGKVEHIEAGLPELHFPPTISAQVEDGSKFADRLSASVRNPSKRVVLPDGNEADKPSMSTSSDKKSTIVKASNKSLFGDSDEEDDFFNKLPSKASVIKAGAPAPTSSRSIFGSDDEDPADGGEDDLFGAKKKSSITGQLKAKVLDGTQGGMKKEKKSLFDEDDDGDDDDDLFGGKSRTISKVNSHHQQTEQTKPTGRSLLSTVTKPITNSTRPGEDPLADLLADG